MVDVLFDGPVKNYPRLSPIAQSLSITESLRLEGDTEAV